jgi:type I restriction enzyme S subunit
MKSEVLHAAEDLITQDAVRESSTRVVPSPAVLIVTRSGILSRTLPVAVTAVDVAINQDIKALLPHASVNSLYVAQALRAVEHEILRDCSKNGTTVASIDLNRLLAFSIPLAPAPDQQPIVEALDSYLSRLDAMAVTLKRVQGNLKRYRASVLMAAVEGRLVPTEAALARTDGRTYESGRDLLVRILADRLAHWIAAGRKGEYKEPGSPRSSPPPELPEGWCLACIAQVSGRVTVGHVGPMLTEYVAEGVPFLRSQNVRENRFDPSGLKYISTAFHAKLAKSMIRPGDVLIVRSGSVGVSCVLPESVPDANCSDLVLVQRPMIVSEFIAYFMNSLAKRAVKQQQVGIALTHFNTKSAAALEIPLPPLAEQLRIVTEVSRLLTIADAIEASVVHDLARIRGLRSTVLRSAFQGDLV